MVLRLWAGAAALALVAGVASGFALANDAKQCVAELRALCPGVPMFAMNSCVEARADQLSDGCRTAWERSGACRAEIRSICGILPVRGHIRRCAARQPEAFTPECLSFIEAFQR